MWPSFWASGHIERMTETKPAESKALLLFRAFCAFPLFVFLTIIFWEIVLGISLLSHWFYEHGWNILGFSAKVVWILLAVLTICITVMFFAGWILLLIRIIRGRNCVVTINDES
jgi:hypothetical protein